MLQLQELSLVVVEVFARALDTAHQALLMLVAFMVRGGAETCRRMHGRGVTATAGAAALYITLTAHPALAARVPPHTHANAHPRVLRTCS